LALPYRLPSGHPWVAAAIALASAATTAQAQVTGSLGVDSDYRYRGVSLSRSKPSVRASVNYDAAERWYTGALLTRAALLPSETYAQLSGYAGWTTARADGPAFEIGLDGSHFAGASHYDFAEAYVGVLADRWSARVSFSADYYGQGIRTAYLEANFYPPLDRMIRLFTHVGALVPLAGAAGDAAKTRFDASVGIGLALGRWDLHVAATGASPGGPYPAVYSGRRAALVAGAAVFF
jgi:uncharacterized protein (TIGR02001 family)